MNKFVIGDTHFGHQNIIEYCNRPFNSVEEMDQYMISCWNEVVGKKDLVYHLGDFFLCNTRRQFEIMSQLNGDIILIRGNHDSETDTKLIDRLGFKDVKIFKFFLREDCKTIMLTHEPVDSKEENIYDVCLNIHAHTHDTKKNTYNSICVSVEMTDYYPININSIIVF